MVGGMSLCAIADVGTGLASSLPFLIVARLMLGAGLSSSDAGASAWVADATVLQQQLGSYWGLGVLWWFESWLSCEPIIWSSYDGKWGKLTINHE